MIINSTNPNYYFSPLPYIIAEYADKVEEFRGFFTGNPENVLYKVNAEGDGDAPPPEEQTKQEVDSLADSEDLAEESMYILPSNF